MNLKVVVFGNDHHNTLGLIRSIGESNLDVFLILFGEVRRKYFCTKSKYVKEFTIVSSEEELIIFLLNNEKLYKSVVFTTGDYYASIIYNNYSILKDKFYLGVNEKFVSKFRLFQDKKYVSKIAEKFNMLIPKEISIDIKRPLVEQINENTLKLPLFLKANSSAIGGKEYTKRFDNYEDCLFFLENNFNIGVDVQVQEYIEKDLEISFLGVSLPNGEVIIPGVIKKIREFPIGFGSSSFAVLQRDIEEFIEESVLRDFVQSIGYSGLFSIEFLVKEGQLFFLEINLRNDGNGYVPIKGGVNLPEYYIKYFNTHKSEATKCLENVYVNKDIYFMNEIGDLKYTISKRRNVFKWFKDIRNTDCFLLFNYKDKKPFFYKFYYQLFK